MINEFLQRVPEWLSIWFHGLAFFRRLVRLFVATASGGDSIKFIYVSHPGRPDATLLMTGGESGTAWHGNGQEDGYGAKCLSL
jgi:hypothetical protein